tara:strand:- start:471 stop:941 length:471 start_codon:yes stop_codon:yes gene_type:complete
MEQTDIFLYQSYHKDPINKLIHFIFIPVIMYSILVTSGKFYYIVYRYKDHKIIFQMGFDELLILFYDIYYLTYGIKIGTIMFLYNLIFYIVSKTIYSFFKHSSAVTFNLFLFAFVIQFLGHFIEGSRPAMFTGLKQTLLQAPLFNLQYLYPDLLNN